jgi:hypothetical protein
MSEVKTRPSVNESIHTATAAVPQTTGQRQDGLQKPDGEDAQLDQHDQPDAGVLTYAKSGTRKPLSNNAK